MSGIGQPKQYLEFKPGHYVHSNKKMSNLVLKTRDGRQVFPTASKTKFKTLEIAKSKVEYIRENYCDCNYCIIESTRKSGSKNYYILPSPFDTKAMEFYPGNWGEREFKIKMKSGDEVLPSELTTEESEKMNVSTIMQKSYCYSY